MGGFAQPPNICLASTTLADEIAPRVRQRLPDSTFHVIGSNPPASVLAHNGGALRVHGFVEDLEPWLDQVRRTIAPLRYGAGVKGKINMSLSYGVPVVGTTIAFKGMHLQNEESVLVADDADAFAAAICRLYANPALWLRLSGNGIEIMHRHFSLETATRDISEALQTATQADAASTRP